MEQTQWADRGQSLQLDAEGATQTGAIGVSRLGSAQLGASVFTVWVQLRGSSWIEAKEGRFELRRGDWIAFERESRPLVQSHRHGVCIGLSITAETLRAINRLAECGLYAGRGSVSLRDARVVLTLWRGLGQRAGCSVGRLDAAADASALRPLLLHLARMQGDLTARIPRCPGRSRLRKRQVFGRLQRAHMYLQGNCDRVVRLSELAELTSFSSWYFSKTFHGLYDESPQAASARMRLERAAELLRGTGMMIGEVAASCGFDNCCSFARAFRARYGVSATHFRSAAALAARADSAKSSGLRGKATAAAAT